MSDKKLEIAFVTSANIDLLDNFIANYEDEKRYFRYFDSRDSAIIKNHRATYLFLLDQQPIGYGHLDEEDNRVWLGIAMNPNFQGKGLGNLMMQLLLSQAAILQLREVFLSVDNDNPVGIHLYHKFGFEDFKINEKNRLMRWNRQS